MHLTTLRQHAGSLSASHHHTEPRSVGCHGRGLQRWAACKPEHPSVHTDSSWLAQRRQICTSTCFTHAPKALCIPGRDGTISNHMSGSREFLTAVRRPEQLAIWISGLVEPGAAAPGFALHHRMWRLKLKSKYHWYKCHAPCPAPHASSGPCLVRNVGAQNMPPLQPPICALCSRGNDRFGQPMELRRRCRCS